MSFVYPGKNSFFLLLLLCSAAYADAQSNSLVVNSKKNSSTTYSRQVNSAIRIVGRSSASIDLTWQPFRGAVSHYVLERSYNGRDFDEAGVFFTGEWSEEPQYNFKDKFRKVYNGTVFYRLRVVGLDGSEVYTTPAISQTR